MRRTQRVREIALLVLRVDDARWRASPAARCRPCSWKPQADSTASASTSQSRAPAATGEPVHQTTTLTSLPRTTITLLRLAPLEEAAHRFVGERAPRGPRLRRADGATLIRPRSLPLTCTTISIGVLHERCRIRLAPALLPQRPRLAELAATARGRHAARSATGTAPRSRAPPGARRARLCRSRPCAGRPRSAVPSPRRPPC